MKKRLNRLMTAGLPVFVLGIGTNASEVTKTAASIPLIMIGASLMIIGTTISVIKRMKNRV